ASPGKSTRALYSYDACVGTPGAPTIMVDQASTSSYLDLAVNGSGAVSGVIDDPSDPAATTGIAFDIASPSVDVAQLTVSVSSSKPAVVAPGGLQLAGSGATRQLQIVPTGVGYSTIAVRVRDPQNNEGLYTIDYAASAASIEPDTSRFHTNTS